MQDSANWAPPAGLFDFSDILAFIADFHLGCP